MDKRHPAVMALIDYLEGVQTASTHTNLRTSVRHGSFVVTCQDDFTVIAECYHKVNTLSFAIAHNTQPALLAIAKGALNYQLWKINNWDHPQEEFVDNHHAICVELAAAQIDHETMDALRAALTKEN